MAVSTPLKTFHLPNTIHISLLVITLQKVLNHHHSFVTLSSLRLKLPTCSIIMAAEYAGRRNSNMQLLEELEELSQSLYQSHTASVNRRGASLALPRTSVPPIPSVEEEIERAKHEEKPSTRQRGRRMSLSPWRSRPKLEDENLQKDRGKVINQSEIKKMDGTSLEEKRGLWNWKPIRAISHLTMQKLSCLFSVEVVTIQGLPASMNGLRLSVCIRKKETKDGAVNTMPSRVSQGAADFEETLFIRCHVYCTSGNSKQHLKFEPRPFLIYVFAVDAEELDFGKGSVDLSLLIQESIEKNLQGTRIRQWERSFKLTGKAKGGELILKLGFQIMEKDGGIGIYSQAEGLKSGKSKDFARKQSKTSFSVPSPRLTSRAEVCSPSQIGKSVDLQGIDELNLDEPAPVPSSSSSVQKSEEPESKIEDLDLPDFEVVDKGVEIQDKEEVKDEEESEGTADGRSVSSEVVKEVVHDQVHQARLTELDSIAEQIKALESMMKEENLTPTDDGTDSQKLDAEEETVTREFLSMLEGEGLTDLKFNHFDISPLKLEGEEGSNEADTKVFIPDLGKGLGCVIQTRNGGYLAAMNPQDTSMARKDTPKLAMQLSKPMVISSHISMTGFDLFQRMAAMGVEELGSDVLSSMPIDELMGKTAEQIAFEGIASAIIHGREKEGASSSAARTIAAVKTMATAMSTGRNERIKTGIWNINEEPQTAEEIFAFSMQKIEAMAIEALKIQAEMVEEDAPFDVSPLTGIPGSGSVKDEDRPLASAVPLEDWSSSSMNYGSASESGEIITILVVVQLRDPLRRYEPVGGPLVALIFATSADNKPEPNDEEKRFKVMSLHIGGLKVRTGARKNLWDSERQKLTAMQWLVAYGLGKAKKKGKQVSPKGQDILWSISSRVMADMWLKSMRNPDIKFVKN